MSQDSCGQQSATLQVCHQHQGVHAPSRNENFAPFGVSHCKNKCCTWLLQRLEKRGKGVMPTNTLQSLDVKRLCSCQARILATVPASSHDMVP